MFRNLLILIIVYGLFACSSLVPREHLVTQEELRTVVLKRFPLYADQGVFHLSLSNPQVALLPERNRIGFSSDFQFGSILGGVLGGRFESSSDLRYDASQRAIVLVKPQLERLSLQDQGEMPPALRALVNLAMAELMQNFPLHTFPPGEPSFAGVSLDITDITVTPGGVKLKFGNQAQGRQGRVE
jgi:hypothetical protein